MNLHRLLKQRAAAGNPVRAGLIGTGKFGSMFLAQVPNLPGLEVSAVADLDRTRARNALEGVGWDKDRIAATDIMIDGAELAARDDVDVVIEATGNPRAGIVHAQSAIAAAKHIIMVNVEADVLAGPLLAQKARDAGVVYSMAYGDQPALVAEMVDWARACGFHVAAAGKGTKYLPSYHHLTPDDVWDRYGLTDQEAADAGMNPKMFNSFMDGTKSAIEMAAIANACDLNAPSGGLLFPPCGVDDLAHVLRPRSVGGLLEGDAMVEVVSSVERDGRPVYRDLRWGVYVVIEGNGDYAASCFSQYGMITDSTGRYTALYRPVHMIGLELPVSVLNAALRDEPTGASENFNADVVAVAKRDLKTGEELDGEGGYTVYGKVVPASRSRAENALPLGLAHRVRLKADIACDGIIGWNDITADDTDPAVIARRAMEQTFAPA